MRKTMRSLLTILASAAILTSCASHSKSILFGSTSEDSLQEQLVWVGKGETWLMVDGHWQRTPAQDYDFLVKQNRFKGFWESLKVQNRNHPDYRGLAGPADQQHHFRIVYEEPTTEGNVPLTLSSTYGNGKGWMDKEFSHAVLEFKADGVSSFAPYNYFRITQHYRYTEGILQESVELFKRKSNGTEVPFVKIVEMARIFTNP
jgi:hypothetical protein